MGRMAMADDGGGRQFLCHAVRSHRLWNDVEFWDHCMAVETSEYELRVSEGVRKAAAAGEDVGAPVFQDEVARDREAFLFDIIGKFVYTMLSMGVRQRVVREFVGQQCDRRGLEAEQAETLLTLATNILASVKGMRGDSDDEDGDADGDFAHAASAKTSAGAATNGFVASASAGADLPDGRGSGTPQRPPRPSPPSRPAPLSTCKEH